MKKTTSNLPRTAACLALFTSLILNNLQAQTPNIFNADIHAHITLKPYNRSYGESLKTVDLWNELTVEAPKVYRFPQLIGVYDRVPTLSCSNFNNLAKGNVRLVFASVCPIQREFTQGRFLSKMIMWNKHRWEETMAFFSGANLEKIRDLKNDHVNYFQETLNELHLISHLADSLSPDKRFHFDIAQSREDIRQSIENDPGSISVLLNIEGGHSLGTGLPSTIEMEECDPEGLVKMVQENVATLKQSYPVFSIGLANHFWNQLCGQTRTNNGFMSTFFDERMGQNDGITPLGYVAIQELLSNRNGNSILIDIKHMSLQSRLDYYNLLATKYNYNVPILYSHGGVNGISCSDVEFKTTKKGNEEFMKDKDKDNKKAYLHQWSFNLYDDEIVLIYKTHGLIGIMLEDTRLGGREAISSIRKTVIGTQQQKDEYIKLFLANAFHIVKTVGEKAAWDIIALGSDFDGAINPMNTYQDASRLSEFRVDMEQFFKRVKNNSLVLNSGNYLFSNEEIIALMYDYSPEELTEKIMGTNAYRFVMENFMKDFFPISTID
ncbi:MAG: dipeptidase [Bacteroidia bacterium]|nr:dipeptidase [Bacteroidia bacterium]